MHRFDAAAVATIAAIDVLLSEDPTMTDLPTGPLTSFGGEIDRIEVSLRVAGDSLDPDEVTRTLGVTPTFAARKGECRTVGGREVRQRTGVWYLEFTGTPEEWTLEDAILTLLRKLRVTREAWEVLATKYELDMFCGLFLSAANRGFALRPEVLRELADRRLELDVDIYLASGTTSDSSRRFD